LIVLKLLIFLRKVYWSLCHPSTNLNKTHYYFTALNLADLVQGDDEHQSLSDVAEEDADGSQENEDSESAVQDDQEPNVSERLGFLLESNLNLDASYFESSFPEEAGS